MRQPLFPQPKEHHPDIDLGILAKKTLQESSPSELKPALDVTDFGGKSTHMEIPSTFFDLVYMGAII